MAKLSKILPITAQFEGGFANVRADRGGMTYKGISRVHHPSWLGWSVVDRTLSTRNIRHNEFIKDPYLDNLVESLYRTKYWNRINGDAIRNQNKALVIFDYAVHGGVKRASEQTQRVLNSLGRRVVVDGKIGLKTIKAINTVPERKFTKALLAEREGFLRRFATGSQRVFLRGLMNRINGLREAVSGKKKV